MTESEVRHLRFKQRPSPGPFGGLQARRQANPLEDGETRVRRTTDQYNVISLPERAPDDVEMTEVTSPISLIDRNLYESGGVRDIQEPAVHLELCLFRPTHERDD